MRVSLHTHFPEWLWLLHGCCNEWRDVQLFLHHTVCIIYKTPMNYLAMNSHCCNVSWSILHVIQLIEIPWSCVHSQNVQTYWSTNRDHMTTIDSKYMHHYLTLVPSELHSTDNFFNSSTSICSLPKNANMLHVGYQKVGDIFWVHTFRSISKQILYSNDDDLAAEFLLS